MAIDAALVGRRLTEIRELGGASLSATAERAGIAKSYLLKLERGEVPNPGLRTLDAVARALGVTLADLLFSGADKAPRSEAHLPDHALPEGLDDFIRQWEAQNSKRMPADTRRSLATIQFRGKRPRSAEDWRYVFETLDRVIR